MTYDIADGPDPVVFGPAHHYDVLHGHQHLTGMPPPAAGGSHAHAHYHPGDQCTHNHPHRHPDVREHSSERGMASLSWLQQRRRRYPSWGGNLHGSTLCEMTA